MSKEQQQSVAQQEDNCSMEDGDFVQLDEPTGAATNVPENWLSFGITAINGNDLNEIKWKIALLEAKNQMLETKVENVELRAKMRDKSMERKLEESEQRMMQISKELANLNAEYQKKKQIQLEDAQQQQKGQMENTEMPEFAKKLMATVKENYQRKITELQVKNDALMEENRTFEQKMKMANDKLEEIMEQRKRQEKVEEFGIKTLHLGNPNGIHWKVANGTKISPDGLIATSEKTHIPTFNHLFAERGFTISAGGNTRKDAIVYYFEVTRMAPSNRRNICVGLTNGNIPDNQKVQLGNSYVILKRNDGDCYSYICGLSELILWPKGAMKPVWKGDGDVLGCGLLQTPANKVYIFFTGNGILMGNRLFPIKNPANYLIPVAGQYNISLEGNFGDNPAKPLKFDVNKCLAFVVE